MTVTLPTGMVSQGGQVDVDNLPVARCGYGESTMECDLDLGSIGASTTVEVAFNAINPSPGNYSMSISTSADTDEATSPDFTITAVSAISDVTSVDPPTSSAAGAFAEYSYSFTTSAQGDLVRSLSYVTITLPTGMSALPVGAPYFPGNQGDECTAQGSSVLTCLVGVDEAPGSTVTQTFFVTNPGPGTYAFDFSTSSDTAEVASPNFTVTSASSVVDASTPNALTSQSAGAQSQYSLSFTTSMTGALVSDNGGVTLTMPSGMTVLSGSLHAAAADWSCTGGTSLSCGITDADFGAGGTLGDIGADTVITASFVATNPSAGIYSIGVATSSDTAAISTPSFTVSPASAVNHVSAPHALTTSAAGVPSWYTFTFTTSTTGALSLAAQSSVTVTMPANMSASNAEILDGENTVAICSGSTTLTCDIGDEGSQLSAAPAESTLTVSLDTTNPAVGSYSIGVATSSDVTPVPSSTFSVTAPNSVVNLTVPQVEAPSTSGQTTYEFEFQPSATGDLETGGTVSVALPPGATVGSNGGTIDDSVTCSGAGTNELHCPVEVGEVVAGQEVAISVAVNDLPVGVYAFGVSTSADTTPINTPTFSVGPSASLGASEVKGAAPMATTFHFTPSSLDQEEITYSLAFGDGSAETGTSTYPYSAIEVPHTYGSPGTYVATLDVSDAAGASFSSSTTITVSGTSSLRAVVIGHSVVAVGAPVTLDGSQSQPVDGISSYQWSFGDGKSGSGAVVQHSYTAPGTYTAELTVTDDGKTSTASTTVRVVPSGPGVTIDVTSGDVAVPQADLEVVAADGTTYSGTTDSSGDGTIFGLPSGTYVVDAYAPGFSMASTVVTVTDGSGTGDVELSPVAVTQTSAESTALTSQQIASEGLNADDPRTQDVFDVSIELSINGSPVTVSGQLAGCGFWQTTVAGAEPVDAGGGCGTIAFLAGGYTIVGEPDEVSTSLGGVSPLVEWLITPGTATWQGDAFEVSVLTTNLAPSASLDGGEVELGALPQGLGLAPTAVAQDFGQSLNSIPAGGSGMASWLLRGDAEGFYGLSASFLGELDPGSYAVDAHVATTPASLHVWGPSAVGLLEVTDATATVGNPYLVNVGLTNLASIPTDNAGVILRPADVAYRPDYIEQPGQPAELTTSALAPGATVWIGAYRFVPESSGSLNVMPSVSAIVDGGTGPTISSVSQPEGPRLSATVTSVHDGLKVTWTAPPVSGIEGYDVFWTPARQTSFGTQPIATALAGATSVTIEHAPSGDYAISAVTASGLIMYDALAPSPGETSAKTSTALTLSRATIILGLESVETLSVKVSSVAGIPNGSVKITDSAGAVICPSVNVAANGTAKCTLKRLQLNPGTYRLSAKFTTNDVDFRSSNSAVEVLKVSDT